MSNRLFDRATLNVPGTKAVPGYKITCSQCGQIEIVQTNTRYGVMAPEGIAQKFRNKGWSVSNRGQSDICPNCAARKQRQKAKTSEDEATKIIAMGISVEQPREMGRDDRRVIFSKINDVYVDEQHGYDTPWSDTKVAVDLGVPVAWVRQVREENFGPESGNAEILAAANEVRALINEAHAAKEEAQKFIDEKSALLAGISARLADSEKKLAALAAPKKEART